MYILGDSITERASDAYKKAFQKYDVNVDIDASVSRGINTPGIDGNKLSGLQAITKDADEIQKADTVVIALGTNGGATAQDIDKVTNSIQGINPDASIFWVNVISVGRGDNFNATITGPTNQSLQQQAKKDGYGIINWFKAVDPTGNPTSPTKSEQDPNKYIDNSDNLGVHPTDAGSSALANLVVSSVGADQNNSAAAGTGTCCATSGSGTVPAASGTISPNVGKGMTSSAQTKFQQILVAAAKKFNIDPNYLAAFYFEENNTDQLAELKDGTAKWREPAPPYGNGPAWPPEHDGGVTGPFQIQKGNIPADGVDGNGDGKIDLNDLTDAAFTAANYLKKSGASTTASDDKLYAAALSYNHADWYATIIMNIYKFLSGGDQSTINGSGSDACSGGAAGSVEAAVQAAKLLSSYQIPYIWGGLHTTGDLDITDADKLKKLGADCSGSTSWVLHQAGMFPGTAAIESGDFSTWGQAGQGQEMTVWENPTHVFIEFNVPGLGHYEMNTSYGEANGLTSGSGPQFFKWESGYTTTDGFTPRHYPGT
ncbi:MAG TPA: GDSL-type esterase/lipase family protein [Verrucomicrobiae bacterium]|nr:GDSL-type esterase/lipase family protein [Verrucomicrobiae bacterium]